MGPLLQRVVGVVEIRRESGDVTSDEIQAPPAIRGAHDLVDESLGKARGEALLKP